jgi:hypothetical protein
VLRLRGGAGAVAAVVLLSGVAGCKDATTGSDGPSGAGGGGGAALAAVDSLTAKGRAPRTGYERSRFGTAWADTDSNSCDTRVISMVHRAVEAFIQLTQGVVGCAY